MFGEPSSELTSHGVSAGSAPRHRKEDSFNLIDSTMKGVTMKNLASITFIAAFLAAASPARAAAPLKCEVYVSDSGSFCVTSTLIYGETEAFLVDVTQKLP